ncbi:hypothetical protein [Nocardia sp. NPDC056000]|uniref:hypothetical protein n=1 Tax=Nocardia sp. NPDC056000 TaxID=3345674 RepID=UPI0035DACB64
MGAVSVRLSPLPKSESLTAHSIAVGFLGLAAFGVVLMSAMIAVRSPVARGRSVTVLIAAAVSILMQFAKAMFAARGHRELRFDNHVLMNSPESLVSFNIPLIVVNTVDILLWLVCLILSAGVTHSLKHR